MATLATLFPKNLAYSFEKLAQGIYESGPDRHAHAGLGLCSPDSIQKILKEMQDALEARDLQLDSYPGIGDLYEEVNHPMEQIRSFLEAKKAGRATPIDDKTASIFESFLRSKMDELREMTGKIDEDYAA